ncbi:hypothetical protein ALC62_16018 [Cyphomyrmex costatus]|uniref:Uncharacterized protein n=1 Tax=Cyphomyrmex costatus TaxID=456900 RepID=A0A151I685_9HYME|nr:hypothetical protein ALC62_16018 [Cyphomyrmex costatus]
MNIFSNKKILQNIGLQTKHKRKPKIRKISQILACKNEVAVQPIRNSYSPKINTKFKKDDIYDIVTQRGSQIFYKIDSQFKFRHKTFRRKDCSKASQDNRSKYSILTSLSDEDDFVRSIQYPRKRSRVSTDEDDNISGKSNIVKKELYDQTKLVICDKDKYSYSRNLNTVTCSSENTVPRGIGSIIKKERI